MSAGGLQQAIWLYVLVGALLALISLLSTWRKRGELSSVLFVLAHLLWPASVVAVLVSALRAGRDEGGPWSPDD